MRSVAQLLPDFGTGPSLAPPAADPAPEPFMDDGYEQGYKAGWDDAVKAQAEDTARIGADLARNLQDLSFTYHEAHAAIVKSLRPLFEHMLANLLPAAARHALLPTLAEQLTELVRDEAQAEVQITVAPENAEAIEAVLADDVGVPVRVRSDPALGAGQARIGVGDSGREVDYDALLAGIAEAVEGFFSQTDRETRHV